MYLSQLSAHIHSPTTRRVPRANRTDFFANAQDTTINRSVIATVQGNAYLASPRLSERLGMKILMCHIASGAFHDAAERGDPPKCHQDTRKAIIAKIMEWRLQRDEMAKPTMWLSGPAGAGKSAIMQTIAEMCAREDILGGSFFFARTSPQRNNPSRFIATIAYQIVQAFPEIQERVVDTIEADQAIFERKLATQVQRLIVRPLKEVASVRSAGESTNWTPKIFLIDALDECLTGTAQHEVLDCITSIVQRVNVDAPPFVFLISSRPEYALRESSTLQCESDKIELRPNYDADLDIEAFLKSTFQGIKHKHSARLPQEWPTKLQMKYLLLTASGQFIYAATAAKYIDSHHHNPSKRLNEILTPSIIKGKGTPFSQLDNLYQLVLGAVADIPMVLEILTFLILRSSKKTWPTIEFVSALFGFNEGDVRLALTDMHALMNVPALNNDMADVLQIHHASMVDFLTDASRSGEFYINSKKGHTHLTISFIRCIMRIQERSVADSPLLVGMIAGFTEHYPRSHLSNELKYALDNFSMDELMVETTPEQFYNTDWNALFSALKKKEYSKEVIHDRILLQFDVGIKAKLRQYPENIRTCIPAAYNIFSQSFLSPPTPISAIIMSQSEECRLQDNTLFMFRIRHPFAPLADFFRNRNRAGTYFPTEASFKALAKEIIENLIPDNGRSYPRVISFSQGGTLEYDDLGNCDIFLLDRYCNMFFYDEILKKCPGDSKFAEFLRNRALQMPLHAASCVMRSGRKNIGKCCLRYIQDCRIKYEDHIHIQDLDLCLICAEYSDPEPTDEGVLDPEDTELLEMPGRY